MNRISTGASVLDGLLEGGYEKDIVHTVFGPAGSGKTNICLISALDVVKSGKKVFFIDTEGGFSVERMKQLSSDHKKVMENIIFVKPTNFEEQKKAFEKLKKVIDDGVGLIVIDSIAMLYRLEMGKSEDIYAVNRELGAQLAYLIEIARTKNIPVLITNQVYSDFDNRERINMVGGDILKYSSKCLVELQKGHRGKRKAVLRKHRSIPEESSVMFFIEKEGLKEAD